jgi:hypothetical protein
MLTSKITLPDINVFALLKITPNDGPLRAHAAAQAAVMGLRSTSYPSLRSVLTSF